MSRMIAALTACALLWSCGGDKGTNDPPQQAPAAPNTPSPTHQASQQEVTIMLEWQCSDPQGDQLVYDIYFGTSDTPPLVASLHPTASFATGQLVNGTIYYWKIVAFDNSSHSTSSPVWSFTTVGNRAPQAPMTPQPENMTQGQLYLGNVFTWTCVDPDGDPLTFDLYVGTSNSPGLVKSGLTGSSYTTTSLDWFYSLNTNTNYYWRVVAHDDKGLSTESPIWQFKTNRAMNLIGSLDPGGTITDIALRGTQLLLVDYGARLLSVDVSTPATPILRQSVALTGIGAVAVHDEYALVARAGQLQVLNATDVANVYNVASTPLSGTIPPYVIRVSGARAYVSSVAGGSSSGYIDIFDITDSMPSLLGTITGPVSVRHMAAGGNALYVGSWGKVYNVTTPGSVTEISTSLPWLHLHWSTGGPNLATDETNQLYALYNSTLYAVDITNPLVPVLTDTLKLPFAVDGQTGMFARGRKAYIATRSAIGPFFSADGVDPALLRFLSWYYQNGVWGEAVVANAVQTFIAASSEGLLVLEIQ